MLLYLDFIVSRAGYCKRFYRMHFPPIFPLFYLFCICWDWQGQKCKLKCLKVFEINSEIYCNCNFYLYSFLWFKYFYPPTSQEYIFVATESPDNTWIDFVWNQKSFQFRHKRNFNAKVIGYIIFNKTVC